MKFRVKTVLVAASLMVSACGGGTNATLDEYRDMYTGWCAYSVEVGVVNNSVTGCVNEMWQAGQSGEMSKPLHESFATMEEMNQYIALESGIRIYCNMIKESPTR